MIFIFGIDFWVWKFFFFLKLFSFFKLNFFLKMMAPKGSAKKKGLEVPLCAHFWVRNFRVHFHVISITCAPPGRLKPPVPTPLHVGKCLGMGLAGLARGMPPWWANEGETLPGAQIFLSGILFL